jgi:hypothetical protein
MPRVLCGGCQLEIDTTLTGAAELVRGYRVVRSGGGANQIALMKGLGRWLCPACLSVAKGNLDLAQGELF